METMHAAGRRNLPPVPRPALDVPGTPDVPEAPAGLPEQTPAEQTMELRRRLAGDESGEAPDPAHDDTSADDDTADDISAAASAGDDTAGDDTAGDDTAGDDTAGDDTAAFAPAIDRHDVDAVLDPARLAVADEPEHALEDDDPAQGFVSSLRAAAGDFASAAGAQTAVVREAVPPARHRRSRCRVVLQYADGVEADLTFLGAVGRPGTPAWQGFDQQIQQWLGTGQQRQSAWLVEDTEAPDGVAVDVPAWLAAG